MTVDPLSLLRETCELDPSPVVAAFVEEFRRRFKDGLAAVVFYGSRLDSETASGNSFFDFYLVCDDYRSVFSRRRDRWSARVLPPNVYFLEIEHEGEPLRCKVCVISVEDLRREVHFEASDLYHLGRFSKRIGLAWYRDTFERDELLGCCWQAMGTITEHAVNKVPNEFTLDEFITQALALSYLGEVRLEKTDEKVAALFAAAPEFYRAAYRVHLDQFCDANPELFHARQAEDPPGTYFMRRSVSQRAALHETTRSLLARSRRRGKMRWFKNILFIDNWLDYLLDKVERTYGVRIELTPAERRWPLILGWRHYFRLRREGKIK